MSRVAAPEQTWTLGRLLDWTARYLAENRSEFPRLDAEVLLAHVAGCKRIELYTRYAEPASEAVRSAYRELIGKRVEGCPVAYLVGRKEFYSLDFEVTPAVLIPRPDTETLVVACLELAKADGSLSVPTPRPAILDVGTGSGCLAVTLAKHLPGAQVTAIDISPEALAVAERNARRHGVADRIRFLRSDLFAELGAGERFDFVVSNPPYIASEEIPRLPVGVRDYEPSSALDGGPGGYRVIERIVREAPRLLAPGGWLIVEIGAPQEPTVRELFQAQSGLELGPTIRDYSGHPRVLRGRRAGE